ncbi:helix-turn-helix domain-containing protein [Clostridium tunisiense]|uniref:helix-turn-helix domain-containing protein n=1 Tax=Clostridium tunisiense TaxID=219748 RepID=UPI0002F2D2F4|nr:helix-turn-helix transcriptional regulator [Clostridium tunisiense]
MIYKVFGEKVREYRKKKDLTTLELSDQLNISSGLLNNIENGKSDSFQLELLNKMVQVLNIPLNEVPIFYDYNGELTVVQNDDNLCIKANLSNIKSKESFQNFLEEFIKMYIEFLPRVKDEKEFNKLMLNQIKLNIETCFKVKQIK